MWQEVVITQVVSVKYAWVCPGRVKYELPVAGERPIDAGSARDGLKKVRYALNSNMLRSCLLFISRMENK